MNDYEVSISRELLGSSAGLATERERWACAAGLRPFIVPRGVGEGNRYGVQQRQADGAALAAPARPLVIRSGGRSTAVILAGGEDQRAVNSVSQFIPTAQRLLSVG